MLSPLPKSIDDTQALLSGEAGTRIAVHAAAHTN
jgi:hypothetical protein